MDELVREEARPLLLERRGGLRVPCSYSVDYRNDEGSSATGIGVEVSSAGFMFVAPRLPRVHSGLDVVTRIGAKPVALMIDVVRTEPIVRNNMPWVRIVGNVKPNSQRVWEAAIAPHLPINPALRGVHELPKSMSRSIVERLLTLQRVDPPHRGNPPLVHLACERSILDRTGRELRVFDILSHAQRGTARAYFRTRLYVDAAGAVVRDELAEGKPEK